MPTITNRKLTLIESGSNVNVVVSYDLRFSRLETNLSELGLVFIDQAQLIGIDRLGTPTQTPLPVVGGGVIPMGNLNQVQTIHRRHERTVTRVSLDEDPTINTPQSILEDDDEIRCRIRVRTAGMPNNVSADTNEQVLVESVHQ